MAIRKLAAPAADERNDAAIATFVEQAAPVMRRDGVLVVQNLFDAALIARLREQFMVQYRQYFGKGPHPDALRVGASRYKFCVALDGAFNTPAVYADPVMMSLLTTLLGDRMVLASMAAVVAQPDGKETKIHRDHGWLFQEVIDRMVPSYAIKLAFPLDDLDARTGTTRMWPGTHLQFGPGDRQDEWEDPYLRRGDCILMDYRVRHQGTANTSDRVRPLIFLSYTRPWFLDRQNFGANPHHNIPAESWAAIPEQHRGLFANARLGLNGPESGDVDYGGEFDD